MSILDRYIGTSILYGCVFVSLILLSLTGFLEFVEQLEDIGKGNYGLFGAINYVLYTTPQRLTTLAPIAALLGSLLAFAMLARNSELIAIRASGASLWRISRSVMMPALIVMLLVTTLLQYAAPEMARHAETLRARAVDPLASGELIKGKGFWSRQGNNIINIKKIHAGSGPADIDIYSFQDNGRLRQHLHAARAQILANNHWRLLNVERKTLGSAGLITQWHPERLWQPFWIHQPFLLHKLPINALSLTELRAYSQYLHNVGQSTDEVNFIFWQKIFTPLITGTMVILALYFSFGNPRNAQFARQLTWGAVMGTAFFLGSQLTLNLGKAIGLPPLLTALLPPLVIGGLLILLIHNAHTLIRSGKNTGNRPQPVSIHRQRRYKQS